MEMSSTSSQSTESLPLQYPLYRTPMNSQQHLDSLVSSLAQGGCQEIAVIKLPSQAKRNHKTLFSPPNRKGPRAKVSA